jgi:hypothetical protein
MNMQYLMPGKNALTTHDWCSVIMPVSYNVPTSINHKLDARLKVCISIAVK